MKNKLIPISSRVIGSSFLVLSSAAVHADIRLNVDITDNATDSYTHNVDTPNSEAFIEVQIPADFQYNSDTGSIRHDDPGFGMWQNLTFLGTTTNTDLKLSAYELQPNGIRRSASYEPYIDLDSLTIDNTYVDSELQFRFSTATGVINLQNNATLKQGAFDGYSIEDGGILTVNSLSGSNYLYNWAEEISNGSLVFNVDDGATLTYGNEFSSGSGSIQRVTGASNAINVADNGQFILSKAGLDLGSGSASIGSNATLQVKDSGAHLLIKDVINDGGEFFIQDNAELDVTGRLTLQNNAQLTVENQSELRVNELLVAGTNTFKFDRSISSQITSLTNSGVSALTLEGAMIPGNLNINTLDLKADFTINVEDSSVLEVDNLQLNGGTINLSKSELILDGATSGANRGVISGTGNVSINNGANLTLGPNLDLSALDAWIEIESGGIINGEGALGSTGKTVRFFGADEANASILSPGTSADPFGTITTNAEWSFYEGLDLKQNWQQYKDQSFLFAGNYKVDIGDNAGAPISDKLVYGDGNIYLHQLKNITVSAPAGTTAGQLIGKEFDIIEPAGGAAGNITVWGRDLNDIIIEDGSLPVLVDIEVKYADPANIPDTLATLTLVAKEADNIALSRNPNLRTRNHQKVAALVPVTVPTLPASPTAAQVAQHTVATAMQTLTNQNVAQDFTSVHPEVVAANTTVNLEQADQMLNTVLSVNSFSSGDGEAAPLASGFLGGIETDRNGVWGNASYIDGKIDGQKDLGDFNYYLSGVSLGSTFFTQGDTYLGSFLSVNQQTMSGHDQGGSNFKGDGYNLGVYGGLALSPSYKMGWAIGHGWVSTEYDRFTGLNTIWEQAKGEYDSNVDYMGLRVTRDTSWLPDLESNIFTGLAYLRAEQEAYSETNAPNLGLMIDKTISHALIASLGLNLKREISEQTRLHTMLRYDYDMEADDSSEHTVNAGFVHTPDQRQSFVGQNRGAHTLSIALGAGHELSDGLDVSVAGLYAHSDHGREIGGEASLNWAF